VADLFVQREACASFRRYAITDYVARDNIAAIECARLILESQRAPETLTDDWNIDN